MPPQDDCVRETREMGKRSYERGDEHAVWFAEAERIIKGRPGKVLSEEQRRFYFEHGYLLVENCVGPEWLARLRAVVDRVVEAARPEKPDAPAPDFILDTRHTPENPRLIRLNSPVDWDDTFRDFAARGPAFDVAADLLGPGVRFHHSKLNFKWHSGGEPVAWHQDIQFWPHCNYSPLTIGVYLEDVDDVMGPLGVIPESHLGPLYPLRDERSGAWTGRLSETDLEEVDVTTERRLAGRAGSITVHNCRVIHGSLPNSHPTRARPLLLQTYSAANAIPLKGVGSNGETSNFAVGVEGSNPGRSGLRLGALISGEEPAAIVFDPRPLPKAPSFEQTGYKPTFFNSQNQDFTGKDATTPAAKI